MSEAADAGLVKAQVYLAKCYLNGFKVRCHVIYFFIHAWQNEGRREHAQTPRDKETDS